MPRLLDATAVRAGTASAIRIFLGEQQIWPTVVLQAVTATYQPGQVTVAWTQPAGNVESLVVRRPNGTTVATVTPITPSLTDLSPVPGTGNYTVAAVVAGVEGTQVKSNSLTLGDAPTVISATWDGTKVNVTWDHNSVGAPDNYKLVRPDGSTAVTVAGTATTASDTAPPRGTQPVYKVVPVLTSIDGTLATTSAVNVPANVPASVTLTALAPPSAGTLRLAWVAPAGTVTGYEVEYSTNGTTWTASTDDASPSDYVRGEDLAGYMRVRAASIGGASSWAQLGPVTADIRPVATVPQSVTMALLAAPTKGFRLTWVAPVSGASQYEVQNYVSAWAASGDDASPSDWATSSTGYMRVRAYQSNTSYNGWSAYVQKGPMTPDNTDPPAASITSFMPESTYARMVVRGNWANNGDVATGEIYWRQYISGAWGAWTKVWGKSAVTPGAAYALAVGTSASGRYAQAQVRTYDDFGNYVDAFSSSYLLVASRRTIDAVSSGTWRVDEWRNDATCPSTYVMHGRTTSGENFGCWFYGELLNDAVVGKTVTGMWVDYCRDGTSQGSSSAIQPQIRVHTHGTRPAGAPTQSPGGTTVLGTGVARNGMGLATAGYGTLSTDHINGLKGSYRGICIYRYTTTTADANAASFYMRLWPAGTSSDGRVSGRVTIDCLG